MKPTQWKDALRNIWKQKVSYLSIIVIAFLGVTTFLGVHYTDAALRRNGSDMYNAVNFRDAEIVSTLLFDAEDLDVILQNYRKNLLLAKSLDAQLIQLMTGRGKSGKGGVTIEPGSTAFVISGRRK